MAVVLVRSTLIHDYLDPTSVAADEAFLRGVLRTATGSVANGATDSANSKYKLARVPSHAILDETTAFQVQNWGFAQVQVGTSTDPIALLNVAKSAANVQNPVVFGDANHGKRLWERLGLAADPGGNITLYLTALAAAVAAGSVNFRISWRV